MPIQTELHRHLDISLRLTTLFRLVKERSIVPDSMTLEQFREKIILTKPLTDLAAVIETFSIFQQIYDKAEVLETVSYEVVEDCWNEGTRKAELRFSPSFISRVSGMSWDLALASIQKGVARALAKYPGMKVGLICIATREFSPEVGKTVDFFLNNEKSFVGFDLAGNEANFPSRHFKDTFKPLRDRGSRITVHAGEAAGPENVWESIELLGAQRIGHGIASIQDAKLMDFLAKHSICLETCPTSNWLTQCVPTLEAHPLPRLLRAGVPVSLNTDDPGVFAITLPSEMEVCRRQMGMTEAEIQACMAHADRASFIV
ncbi:MAG TPA: adenosine deaminase [Bdellovibrionota bacterium]|nr:adenosine deaminase [Bdellovibrionota bacterium]